MKNELRKDVEMMYYACEEHIELALDIVVDEQELAPTIDKITDKEMLSTKCSFCENGALYSIKA
ncbi:CxxH/CxxC protein [Halalkalibacter nanhaiisediminis]